jgi:Uma2 family endonuclease
MNVYAPIAPQSCGQPWRMTADQFAELRAYGWLPSTEGHFELRDGIVMDITPEQTKPRLITADEFIWMAGLGVFNQPGEFELHDGVVVQMNAKHIPHIRMQVELTVWLTNRIRERNLLLYVGTEPIVKVTPQSTREPDLVVFDDNPEFTTALPPQAVRLAVEVAHTSAFIDLGEKNLIYAQAGIPHYWVVDIVAQCTHVHQVPTDQGYTDRAMVRFDEPLKAPFLDEPLIISTLRV